MRNFLRTNFIKTVNGEKDFLLSTFQYYKFKRPFKPYRLQYEDYIRPDLISTKVYGKDEYWWIILKVNPEYQDIWNDYVVNDEDELKFPDAYRVSMIINIPDILDIQEFITFSKTQIEKL